MKGSRTWLRLVALGLSGVLVAAGCGDDDGGGRAGVERDGRDRDDDADDDEATTTTEEVIDEQQIDLEDVDEEDQDDVIIEAAIDEVEAFWAEAFPETFGGEFEPVSGGFFPYGPDRELPECGGPVTYDDIAANAFYCPPDDLIAWDTDNLTNDLLAEFGPFSLVIVMAHEYGHAIQTRIGLAGPTIVFEQQADCFAGAFTAFVEQGGSDVLTVGIEDLNQAVAGFIQLRDAVGTPSTDPNAHGSAFDRVGAFQDGFVNGASRCAEYEEIFDDGGTTVVDIPLTEADLETGGDAPFDPAEEGDIFELTLGSLEEFWEQLMPEFAGQEWDPLLGDDQIVAFDADDPDTLPSCPSDDGFVVEELAGQAKTCFGDPDDPSDDVIAFDQELAADLYRSIGDFAISGLLAKQYAYVAQVLDGNLEDDLPSNLQADCLAGVYSGEVTQATLSREGFPFNDAGDTMFISAGDLDEVVVSFLLLGEDLDAEIVGTPFQRVDAFRTGFFGGLDSCVDLLEDA